MRWKFLSTSKTETDLVSLLLKNRRISKKQEQSFLNPNQDQIHDAGLMADVASAAKLVAKAIEQGKQILIHGDFDVDGVTATAVLWDFLYREAEAKVLPYIPNRFTEGYSLSEQSIQKMKDMGAELVITVDCGIRDQEIIAAHPELDFIITDHHSIPTNDEGQAVLPSAAKCVVHPGHPQGKYPFRDICGANVAWKLAWAIRDYLKLDTDMFKYIDLVALATVCDVMPLVDENRAIVKAGLERLNDTRNIGLKKLLEVSGYEQGPYSTYNFGYGIGPRINAAGRLESAMTALKLLTTEDPLSAHDLANKLNALNINRQRQTADLLNDVQAQIAAQQDNKLMFLAGENWPEGILGLVAGKLTQEHYRPVIVNSLTTEGIIKASARSTSEFNIVNALDLVAPHLQKYGGHAQAAGLSYQPEKIELIQEALLQHAEDLLTEESLQPVLTIDAWLSHDAFNVSTIEMLEALSPFGFGNDQPVFAIDNLKLLNMRTVGRDGRHLKLLFGNDGGQKFDAIGFNKADLQTEFSPGDSVQIAGQLEINEWRGNRSPQILLSDLRVSE